MALGHLTTDLINEVVGPQLDGMFYDGVICAVEAVRKLIEAGTPQSDLLAELAELEQHARSQGGE
jgi:hypothetical protein